MNDLSPSKFLQSVNFPADWQEAHLQNYLANWYTQQGYKVGSEVSCEGGRADLVCDKNGLGMIIEVKKWLDRNAILGAYGQGKLYQEHLTLDGIPMSAGGKARMVVVIGLLTTRYNDIEQAYRQADRVAASGGVVVFVDQCKDYYPRRAKTGIYIPVLHNNYNDNHDNSYESLEADATTGRRSRDTVRSYRKSFNRQRHDRSNFNTKNLITVLRGVLGASLKVIRTLIGLGQKLFRAIATLDRQRRYGRKPKFNILFVYVLIAVLAVGFDVVQRAIHSIEQSNYPTRNK